MNFNGLNDLDLYFGVAALAIMLVTLTGILLGLKFRTIGYKVVVLVLSLGVSVLSYFCFRHEINFPIIGSLFLVESLVGFAIIFVRKP
nr:hypothetical protein [uncultured Fluviicola sp.]